MSDEKRVKDFYEKIKELTKRIGELELPDFFKKEVADIIQPSWLDSAGNLTVDGVKMLKKTLTNKLISKDADLYKKMQEFFEDYSLEEDYRIIVFDSSTETSDQELIKYDPNEIDPINLCFLMVFSDEVIDEYYLFEDYREFYPYVEEKDVEFASFIKEHGFNSFFKLAQFVCKINL